MAHSPRRIHDPTTLNRQGNDVGTQYRSAVFYYTPEQKKDAEDVKKEIENAGRWKNIVTEVRILRLRSMNPHLGLHRSSPPPPSIAVSSTTSSTSTTYASLAALLRSS